MTRLIQILIAAILLPFAAYAIGIVVYFFFAVYTVSKPETTAVDMSIEEFCKKAPKPLCSWANGEANGEGK